MEQLIHASSENLETQIKSYCKYEGELLLIIDDNISQLYPSLLKNITPKIWISKSGEETKTLTEYQKAIEFFLKQGVHRNSHLITLGGGSTSDFGGFIASTLLRGISWSAIPTTLLAMVDAAIGGKTGIDSNLGKNLIGSFHHPDFVFLNNEFLNTLEPDQVVSGMGEVIKYALLDRNLRKVILSGKDRVEIIRDCIAYKQQIVQQDFKEKGQRVKLNLGHTFGHGIEKFFHLSHGESVIFGCYLIFWLTDNKKLLNLLKQVKESLINQKLSFVIEDGQWDELIHFMLNDKKNLSDTIQFVTIDMELEDEYRLEGYSKEALLKIIREKTGGASLAINL